MLRLEPRPTSHGRSPSQHSQAVARVSVARDNEPHAAIARQPGVNVVQVEPVHLTVDFQCDAELCGGVDDGVDVERVRIAFENEPSCRVAEHIDVRIRQRAQKAIASS